MEADGGGIELSGISVDEEYALSRVTSLDALNVSSPLSRSSSSSSQGDADLYRVSSMEHLAPSSPSPYPLSPSTPDLSTSLDNLTRMENDGATKRNSKEGKEEALNTDDGSQNCPEHCAWVFKYLGWKGEMDCMRRGIMTLLRMHLFSGLCLLVVGTYIAIYVPLVISRELKFRLENTEYRDVPRSTRLALAVGYGLHNAYVGLFGLIIMMLVVGYQRVKFMIPFNIFMFCAIVGYIFSYYWVESWYRTIHGFYSIIVYILIGVQVLGTAGAFGFKVHHTKAVLGFTATVTIALLVFVGIIDYVGVPLFMDASPFGKSIFRISVIPSILVIKVVVIRAVCRFSDFSNLYMNTDGGGTLSFTIALIPVFVRAFYGRIFYLNVPTLGNLAWNAIVVEVFDIFFKLAHWNRRYALNVFQPLVRKYYFLKPLLDKPSGDSFYALCLCYEKAVDVLAIGYATLIQILYQSKWESNPDYAATIYSFIIQYAIETIAQVVSFRLEHGFGIPSLTITKRTKFWAVYPILVSISLMIAVTCTWRGVFIVHGEYWIK